jgi:hypothetical protein
MTDMKRIREALCLFKSMVDCGERASQTSSEAFENAMGDSLAVDAELTALRAEVKTYENEVAQSHINELRLANEMERLTKENQKTTIDWMTLQDMNLRAHQEIEQERADLLAERRAIAEAVRKETMYTYDGTDYPAHSSHARMHLNELADRIEQGEVK